MGEGVVECHPVFCVSLQRLDGRVDGVEHALVAHLCPAALLNCELGGASATEDPSNRALGRRADPAGGQKRGC
jgi:hypothetical protein